MVKEKNKRKITTRIIIGVTTTIVIGFAGSKYIYKKVYAVSLNDKNTTISDTIEDNVNGVIIPLNVYGLYDKAVDLILNNKEKYKEELKKFDYEVNNQKIVSQWKELFNANREDEIERR